MPFDAKSLLENLASAASTLASAIPHPAGAAISTGITLGLWISQIDQQADYEATTAALTAKAVEKATLDKEVKDITASTQRAVTWMTNRDADSKFTDPALMKLVEVVITIQH